MALPREIILGDDLPLALKVEIDELGNAPENLEGYSFWFTAKTALTDADEAAALRLTPDDWLKVGTAAYAVVPAATTKTLTGGEIYLWDIQVRTPGGRYLTPHRGSFITLAEITQATSS